MPQFKTWFQTCGCQVLTIIFTCVHVLEDKVMKDMNLTYTVEILYRKKNQDLESQVLSRAIIVKTWGHGVAKNVTFQDLADQVLKEKCKISDLLLPSLDNHVHLWSRLAKPSHESSYLSLTFKFFTPKSLKTWKAKS